ncbi:MAG: DUF177 domain-containing protein [Armatimonadota bacterium]|nr:DUF177 domain-containing protein [Armatimonadota bacterium]MDR5697462.1 DUF177 domain-containing protein [Armatimonadota bacterium]
MIFEVGGQEVMRVAFSDVFAAPGAVVHRTIRTAIPSGVPDIAFGAVVEGHVELRGVGRRVYVTGRARAEAELVCSRCLRTFTGAIDATVEEIFDPGLPQGDAVWTDGGLLVMPAPYAEVDVTELVRQHLVLAVPYAPLCRADCAGLCPVCGADRNVTGCGCRTELADARWRALESISRGTKAPSPGGPMATAPRRPG